jgi:hypothetical protein
VTKSRTRTAGDWADTHFFPVRFRIAPESRGIRREIRDIEEIRYPPSAMCYVAMSQDCADLEFFQNFVGELPPFSEPCSSRSVAQVLATPTQLACFIKAWLCLRTLEEGPGWVIRLQPCSWCVPSSTQFFYVCAADVLRKRDLVAVASFGKYEVIQARVAFNLCSMPPSPKCADSPSLRILSCWKMP